MSSLLWLAVHFRRATTDFGGAEYSQGDQSLYYGSDLDRNGSPLPLTLMARPTRVASRTGVLVSSLPTLR